MVSAGHVGGTRGSGIVSSAADVLWMSAVRGMRGLCLGFTYPLGTGEVLEGRVSVFWLRWCRWGVGREIGPGSGARTPHVKNLYYSLWIR